MASQTEKINQSITTAEQVKHQTQLLMQPYANWERYLTPAPLSIAIMGELVYISSKTDFSIIKNPVPACLLQMCNSGWKAFNEAYKNMDEIRLHILKVPDYMRDAVKILLQGVNETAQTHLENINAVSDKCFTLAAETEKGFTDVINFIEGYEKNMQNSALQSCEVKEMLALSRLKEEWEKTVRFFQMVSSFVKTSLTVSLKHFVTVSEKTQSFSYNGKLFCQDQLYNQAFQANNITDLVHMILGTYTQVSEKYLIDQISTLGKLMAMDKEKPEFQQEREQLQTSCESAQKDILQIVLKNKTDFEKNTNSRLEKIDKELLAVFPPAPSEKMKSIEASVKAGFTEHTEDNYI